MSLLEVKGLAKRFGGGGVFGRGPIVHAVEGVDLSIDRGEIVGLVGESGCGKTTLGKTILRLLEPSAGTLRFDGSDITHASQRALRPLRKRMQIVFQDPYASLNPRATVEATLSEAVRFHRIVPPDATDAYVDELLSMVGLSTDARRKYPHEFSGGQRQRVGIARALSVKPDFLLLDEPVSALDVSIQAQILNLLSELRERLNLTYLFISHDLNVVQHFCQRVLVMYLGRIVEEIPAEDLSTGAKHPYTRALLEAVPRLEPREGPRPTLPGDVPSPIAVPPGCAFADRCALAEASCRQARPELLQVGERHRIACPIVER